MAKKKQLPAEEEALANSGGPVGKEPAATEAEPAITTPADEQPAAADSDEITPKLDAAPAEDEDDGLAADAPEPADEPAPAVIEAVEPEPYPTHLEVKLVGAKRSVLGSQAILKGESRLVRWHDYVTAERHNPDIFLVRLPGENEWVNGAERWQLRS